MEFKTVDLHFDDRDLAMRKEFYELVGKARDDKEEIVFKSICFQLACLANGALTMFVEQNGTEAENA